MAFEYETNLDIPVYPLDKRHTSLHHSSMGPFKHKNISQFALIAVAFAVMNLSFNNCGGVGSSTHSASLNAQMTYDSKVEALAKLHAGQLAKNFCADSRNFSCLHKVFSSEAQADDSRKSAAVCTPLIDGTELCPETTDYLYSTASAIKNCQENCDGVAANGFESEEFECHVKLSLKADAVYPLVAVEKDFNSAVEKVYQSCLAIQKGYTE